MSRFSGTGTDPIFGNEVMVAFGWDNVPGFKPGYFFQVWNVDSEGNENYLMEEGMLEGISREEVENLKNMWAVKEIRTIFN